MAQIVKSAWARALVVSIAVSAVFTIGGYIAFGGGARYIPYAVHQQIAKMSYEEATAYLLDRTMRLSGWEAFLDGATVPEFWLELAQVWLFLAVLAFACCAVLLMWQHRAPSNPTVERDARKNGARPSP